MQEIKNLQVVTDKELEMVSGGIVRKVVDGVLEAVGVAVGVYALNKEFHAVAADLNTENGEALKELRLGREATFNRVKNKLRDGMVKNVVNFVGGRYFKYRNEIVDMFLDDQYLPPRD